MLAFPWHSSFAHRHPPGLDRCHLGCGRDHDRHHGHDHDHDCRHRAELSRLGSACDVSVTGSVAWRAEALAMDGTGALGDWAASDPVAATATTGSGPAVGAGPLPVAGAGAGGAGAGAEAGGAGAGTGLRSIPTPAPLAVLRLQRRLR